MPTKLQKNFLLAYLTDQEQSRIIEDSELVDLEFGQILCKPEEPYKHVYFPLTAFISLLDTVDAHPAMEMGLIGNEGMLGVTLILGIDEVPLHAVVQGTGTAYKMPVSKFKQAFNEMPVLLLTLNHFLFVTMAQLAQTVGCTRFHEVNARLARWLLMTHDRSHANHFHLTHQYLADMLGVQRSAVTIAAGNLQQQNFISYTRGRIKILDRIGLEGMSCECYRAISKDYAKQLS